MKDTYSLRRVNSWSFWAKMQFVPSSPYKSNAMEWNNSGSYLIFSATTKLAASQLLDRISWYSLTSQFASHVLEVNPNFCV